MPTEVIMPKVDMDMATGTIAVWHVAEGAVVEAGAPLFDIETDKAAMEVEAPASGILRHVRAGAGAEIPIGETIGWIYAEGEDESAPPRTVSGPLGHDKEAAAATPTPDAEPAPVAYNDASAPQVGRRATPAARRAATQSGLDLSDIVGSGPRGRIQKADVQERLARAADTGLKSVPDTGAAAAAARIGDLPVLRSGSGTGTAFVFLHGFAADAGVWNAVDPWLPAGHPRLKIELPGHGRAPTRHIDGFEPLIRHVRAIFEALDVGNVHLVGHSLGGALALALADTRPRQIASLTLLCPAGLGPEINGAVLDGILRARRAESLAPWLRQLVADPDGIGWGYVQAAMASRADPEIQTAQDALSKRLFPDGTQAFDLTAALGRVSCPTRIIWGREDRVIPWQHALRAPGRVALHLFDRVGHLPQIEAAEETAGLIAKVS